MYGAPKPDDIVISGGYGAPPPPSSSYGAPPSKGATYGPKGSGSFIGHHSKSRPHGSRPIPVPASVPLVPNNLVIPRPPSKTYDAPWPLPSGRRPGGSGVYVPTSTPGLFSSPLPTTTHYPSTVRPLTHSHDHHGKPCIHHHGGSGLSPTPLPITPLGSTFQPPPEYPPYPPTSITNSFGSVPKFNDTYYSSFGTVTGPPLLYKPFTTVTNPPLSYPSDPCSLPPAFTRTNDGSPCLQPFPGSVSSFPGNPKDSTTSDDDFLSILTNDLNSGQHDGSGSLEHAGGYRDSRQSFPPGGASFGQVILKGPIPDSKEVNTPATIFENGWRYSNFSLLFPATPKTPTSQRSGINFPQKDFPSSTPRPFITTTREGTVVSQGVLRSSPRPLITTLKDGRIVPFTPRVTPTTFRPPTTRQGRFDVFHEQVTPSREPLTEPSVLSLNPAFPGGSDTVSHHGPNVLWSLQNFKRHASQHPPAFNLTQYINSSSALTQQNKDGSTTAQLPLPTVVKFPLQGVKSRSERSTNKISNHSIQPPRTLRPLTETTTDAPLTDAPSASSSEETQREDRHRGLPSPSRLPGRPRPHAAS